MDISLFFALILGVFIGSFIIYLIYKSKIELSYQKGKNESEIEILNLKRDIEQLNTIKNEYEKLNENISNLQKECTLLKTEKAKYEEQISRIPKLEDDLVNKDKLNEQLRDLRNGSEKEKTKFEEQITRIPVLEERLSEKEKLIENFSKEISDLKISNSELRKILEKENEKFEEKIQVYKDAEEKLRVTFENLANKLLSDKVKSLDETSTNNFQKIIQPFQDNIKDFKQLIDKKFTDEAKDVSSLKEQINNLLNKTSEISHEANNLAKALTGESKKMGNWGEAQLEKLFEYMGLKKDIHFIVQPNFTTDEGKKVIPDFIIKLPDDKNLVIDSKVSIAAYEKYFESDNEEDKRRFLNDHLLSIDKHVSELSGKEYQKIYQINQPDFVLMYVPIEPALLLAFNEDKKLFERAYNKNIIILSSSILLATLKTISYIWKQENQKQNVLEIARVGGALYDKFVDFIEDMKNIDKNLDAAKNSYNDAMKKLTESTKKGTTIIGRIEQIKQLGAKTSKSLPADLFKDDNLIMEEDISKESLLLNE